MPQEEISESQVDPYTSFNSQLGKIWEDILRKGYQDAKEEGESFSPPSLPPEASTVPPGHIPITSSTPPVLAFNWQVFREDWKRCIIQLAQKRYGYVGMGGILKRPRGEVDSSSVLEDQERKAKR
jgi:hypothetical protein